MRQEPIPPPSEPMQYRAIGLILGQYIPSEEEFNQGKLIGSDGCEIPVLILGRVVSLVKNHLNLEYQHLWVVYPRTYDSSSNQDPDSQPETELRFQIVGIWEPETLQKPVPDENGVHDSDTENLNDTTQSTTATRDINDTHPIMDGYFSIRGEVLHYSEKNKKVIVKIEQIKRKKSLGDRFFKLTLFGSLPGDRVRHQFWSFTVRRNLKHLVIEDAQKIGALPPKQRKKLPKSRPQVNSRPRKTTPSPDVSKKPVPIKTDTPNSAIT